MDDGNTFPPDQRQEQTDGTGGIIRGVVQLAVGGAEARPSHPPPGDNTPQNRAAEDPMFIYRMNSPKRGLAVIISNSNFLPQSGMISRPGTDKDADDLCRVLKTLGFEIKLFKDMAKKKMIKLMRELSHHEIHQDSDCFACAVLSHGEGDEIYGIDEKFPIDELVAPFKGHVCPPLVGKPKLFFFQACRGWKLDPGIEVPDSAQEPDWQNEEVTAPRIPTEADFLMCYAVVPGYFCFRNVERGSWFIQSLCHALTNYSSTLDISRIMNRVCYHVAYDYESNAANPRYSQKKQIPCIVSMLTKDLYFNPK